MLSDETLVKWARGEKADGLHDIDIALSSDVTTLMPLLYYISRNNIVRREGPSIFIEIGTADGSTALPLVKSVAELNGHLHSVDPSGCERAHELVKWFGYQNWWTHQHMKSDDFFARNPGIRIDFAFIDGDHAWPQTKKDILNCWRALWPGGIVFASDLDPLFEDGPIYKDEETYSQQCVQGIARGFQLAAPELKEGRAQMMQIGVKPNPSILIRKPFPGEIFA